MSTLKSLIQPLRAAAAAFFKHDLAVQREGKSVRVVLEERGPGGEKKPSRAEVAARKEKAELAQMRAELAALLNELPETRQTMRHLVFVEQALAKKGVRALHKIPLDVLRRALEQLEGLVLNWSPAGLANLRSKMAVAVLDRENMDPDAEAEAYKTAAVLESTPAPAAADEPGRSDDEALAAAYAALGSIAPGPDAGGPLSVPAPAEPTRGAALDMPKLDLDERVEGPPSTYEMQGDLGSASAKALLKPQSRLDEPLPQIKIRELA